MVRAGLPLVSTLHLIEGSLNAVVWHRDPANKVASADQVMNHLFTINHSAQRPGTEVSGTTGETR